MPGQRKEPSINISRSKIGDEGAIAVSVEIFGRALVAQARALDSILKERQTSLKTAGLAELGVATLKA